MCPQILQEELQYPLMLAKYPRVCNHVGWYYTASSYTVMVCSDLIDARTETCSPFRTPLLSSRTTKFGHITAEPTASTIIPFTARTGIAPLPFRCYWNIGIIFMYALYHALQTLSITSSLPTFFLLGRSFVLFRDNVLLDRIVYIITILWSGCTMYLHFLAPICVSELLVLLHQDVCW